MQKNRDKLYEAKKEVLNQEKNEKIKIVKEKKLQNLIQEKINYDPNKTKKINRQTRQLRYYLVPNPWVKINP